MKKSIANLGVNDFAGGYGIPLAFPGIETCQNSVSEKCPGTLRNIKKFL
jgi:hypothetical protein